MSLCLVSAPQFSNTLANLDHWLDKAVESAAARVRSELAAGVEARA